ncbi:MAG TPA: AraC family transcriptional regulator [Polyangia bacterium]|nr:AraC family transcriptional regulator [Polyangia bacterium]
MPEALYQPFPMPGAARAHVWHHVPETRRPRHFHSEPELNLIAAGSGAFGFGDLTVRVAAGDLLWWSPGQDHVLLDASPDFDLFVIGATPDLSARVLGSDSSAAFAGATRVRLDPGALARLRARCEAPLAGDPGAVERRVGDLWRDAHACRLAAPDKHTFTSRALASLIERPELRRSDVASMVRGHPTEVSRHFHKDVGLTLTEYRTRLRLLRFIEAARAVRPNLLLAALEAGFGSYSQCHRAFQHTLGCSPRQYFRAEVRARMEEAFLPFR